MTRRDGRHEREVAAFLAKVREPSPMTRTKNGHIKRTARNYKRLAAGARVNPQDFAYLMAPKLKKRQTPPERILATELCTTAGRRRNGIRLRFRPQFAWGKYVLDFYCRKAMIDVEVDGRYHEEPAQRERDRIRDAYLAHRGVTVVRIPARIVYANLPEAIRTIKEAIRCKPEDAASI